jgi:hypothetical protein
MFQLPMTFAGYEDMLTLQLHKKYCQRQVGMLEKLYSGTFYHIAAPFPNILQRSP